MLRVGMQRSTKSQLRSTTVDESILADVLLAGEQGEVKEQLQDQELKTSLAESVPRVVERAVSHWKM
eukprot:3413575-Amphidinium_carterae.1